MFYIDDESWFQDKTGGKIFYTRSQILRSEWKKRSVEGLQRQGGKMTHDGKGRLLYDMYYWKDCCTTQ